VIGRFHRLRIAGVALLHLSLLAACGGGGDDEPTPAPQLQRVEFSVDEDSDLAATVTASDAEGRELTFRKDSDPSHGELISFEASGGFIYRPNANFTGMDSFEVTVKAAGGGSDSGVVTIEVENFNDAPSAQHDLLEVAAADAAAIDVLANDVDPDEEPLAVEITESPFVGAAAVNDDGSIRLDLPSGFHGMTRFTYSVTDEAGESSEATALVFIDSPAHRAVFVGRDEASASEVYLTDFVAPIKLSNATTDRTSLESFRVAADGSTVSYIRLKYGAVDTREMFAVITAPLAQPVPIPIPASRTFREDPDDFPSVVISDDGRWIAFLTDSASGSFESVPDLYVFDTERPDEPARVVGGADHIFSQQLVFSGAPVALYFASAEAYAAPHGMSLYRVEMDALDSPMLLSAPQVDHDGIYGYRVAPDDSKVVLLAHRNQVGGFYLIDPRNPGDTSFLAEGGEFRITPDFSQIVYLHGDALLASGTLNVVDVALGAIPRLLAQAEGTTVVEGLLDLSVDGGKALFWRTDVYTRVLHEIPLDQSAAESPLGALEEGFYDHTGARIVNKFPLTLSSGPEFPTPSPIAGDTANGIEFGGFSPDRSGVYFTEGVTFRTTFINLDAPDHPWPLSELQSPYGVNLRVVRTVEAAPH
jgi:hypothetical protein